MSHSCEESEKLFVPYLLGETTDDENISVFVAIAVCETCSKVLTATRRVLKYYETAIAQRHRNDLKLFNEIMEESNVDPQQLFPGGMYWQ